MLLINSRLTPILTYRMTAHSLPETTIVKLDSLIWTRLVNTAEDSGLASIPPNTPPAFKYSVPSAAGLKMNFIPSEIHRQNINLTNRFLMKEAPADAANSVISALRSHSHNSFQQSVMNFAYFFRACMFGVPTMNPFFGFRPALRPPAPPVGPDPWLWGHILLFVLTPVIPLCRLL